MQFSLQSMCQLAFLSLCCVLIAAGSFVPGRCLCPDTQNGVRGQLKELSVYPKSASCNKITVIVTLRSNNETRCLNPDTPLGKQLIRCWNKAQKLGRDPKLCLKRRRRGRGGQRQRSRQRIRGHNRKSSSSHSQ
ncbi:C-X-C motif chemokine 10-like [Cheilinus undulatus]|uniref:C-X-C motif chemokine 10-like n=1 Tax=Cheilinus undulatus TaxID=241271 RepID=UPI001BD670EB|nr:C-X-C motif chemokine 10-like [Cheilinus undulatus]